MSIVGVVFLLALGYLCSSDRRAISLRTVGGAFAIQVTFAVFVLATRWGKSSLKWLTDRVEDLVGAGNEGIMFVFGGLSDPGASLGFVFAVSRSFEVSSVGVLLQASPCSVLAFFWVDPFFVFS